MHYHLALGSLLNLDEVILEAQQGNRPGHAMWNLRQELDAIVHMPTPDAVQPIDHIRAKLISLPEHWALARQLSERLGKDDVIYCNGEDIGIPLATLCQAAPHRPKIICFFHTANRPRVRMMLKLFRLQEKIDVFVSNTAPQFDQLRQTLNNIDESRLFYLPEQIDVDFFCPGPPAADKSRPVIASVGLEKRDYKILAQATADLEVDVKISGFSRDVRPLAKSFPKILPANMSRRFYAWTELVQLYRDADIVVVSLFESIDSAGITTLLEAMACGRPVISTETKGLADYLQTPGTVMTIKPGDLQGLKSAIAHLLNHPEEAELQGKRAYKLATSHHNTNRNIAALSTLIRSVS
ncbi:MAG: glycosyltransferase family 4 protein [Leptolyngbyaceae cyanobacterium bins.349]|nr:glycosyltransferase family 4 protein [Leptolyngbyaceae cyanobacterium bins.349]